MRTSNENSGPVGRTKQSLIGLLVLLVGFLSGMFVSHLSDAQKGSPNLSGKQWEPGDAPSKEETDPFGSGWMEDLDLHSGRWVSDDPRCDLELDRRVLQFSAQNHWGDLDNGLFLLGPTRDFITSDAVYQIGFLDSEEGFLTLVRRERPGFEKWHTVRLKEAAKD